MNAEIKPRVLVIDDEMEVRTWLKGLLISLGCEIAGEAENGREGLELFKKERPDLVLLDLNMPVMTGVEALDFILGEDPEANVIMLTSVTDEKVIQDRMIKGAQYYLPKHNPPDEIKAVLQEQLEKIKAKLEKSRDNE
ncbi:MAG: response regulator transcription factor [Candidatus Marinimicrobia bacterium]|nr:response regulator transcription factor [Candidatus Neomarinimicrobiota bacterium]